MFLRHLESGHGGDSVTLDLLGRLASGLGLEPRELLTSEADSAPSPDAAALGALLAEITDPISAEAAADLLGWALDRTLQAAETLEALASTVGFALRRLNAEIQLVPSGTAASADVLTAAHHAQHTRRGLSALEARLLHQVMFTPSFDKRRLTAAETVALGQLRNAGLVDESVNENWMQRQQLGVAADVSYSVMGCTPSIEA